MQTLVNECRWTGCQYEAKPFTWNFSEATAHTLSLSLYYVLLSTLLGEATYSVRGERLKYAVWSFQIHDTRIMFTCACVCDCSDSWMNASLSILWQAVVLLKVLFMLKENCPLHCHMLSLRQGWTTLMVVRAEQFFFDGGLLESKQFRPVKTPPIVLSGDCYSLHCCRGLN